MSTALGVRSPCSGAWAADPGFGVYLHIPFCAHRCSYCDFNTYEGLSDLHEPYVDALVEEIERWTDEVPAATSVFVGGGTPTLLPATALSRILQAVRRRIGVVDGGEVTVEANPDSVTEPSLAALVEAGFNRISIGVQSLSPHVLRGLGRTHSPEKALAALAAARRAGFAEINADLIYGSVWEEPEDWRNSLHGVVAAGPDHVSAYALTIEEGTPLGTLVKTGRVDDVDPDVQAERYEITDRILGAAGYVRYEISNWARLGSASRHNVLYWSGGDYLGFGAGAHAHIAGRRWWSTRLPRSFIDSVRRGVSTEDGFEVLGPAERAAEAWMLGLRLTSGIDERAFGVRFGHDFLLSRDSIVAGCMEEGLLERHAGRVRLTDRATFVANEVACRFL